ncbi:hypothetical protein D7I39_08270 [Allopusillimonas ginsengisoli]|nr:hypothetical protein D7I39_08270 [Allopusillimonas ginsengisoli]
MPFNKVVAGALCILAANNGDSLGAQNLQRLQQDMSPQDLKQVQALAEAMIRPDQLLTSLDASLEITPS